MASKEEIVKKYQDAEAVEMYYRFTAFQQEIADFATKYKDKDTEYRLDGVADTLHDAKLDFGEAIEIVFGINVFEDEEE